LHAWRGPRHGLSHRGVEEAGAGGFGKLPSPLGLEITTLFYINAIGGRAVLSLRRARRRYQCSG